MPNVDDGNTEPATLLNGATAAQPPAIPVNAASARNVKSLLPPELETAFAQFKNSLIFSPDPEFDPASINIMRFPVASALSPWGEILPLHLRFSIFDLRVTGGIFALASIRS
jgi:hypothetical protein